MTVIAYINELAAHVGQIVTVRGWLHNKRSSGKIAFLIVRDGTGLVQAVMSKADVSDEAWSLLEQLEYEASLEISGTVREDARAPGGYELSLTALELVGPSSKEYPIQLKEHGIDFLLEHRHLWLRTPRQVAIMRVRNEVTKSIRDYLYDNGFINVDTPILTSSIGESAGTLFETFIHKVGQVIGTRFCQKLRLTVSGLRAAASELKSNVFGVIGKNTQKEFPCLK